MNRSEFLDLVDLRFGEPARRGSERIINAADRYGFAVEYRLTASRGDARAIFSRSGYTIFGIFAYNPDNIHANDAQFVIYSTNDFEKHKSELATLFIPYWKATIYDSDTHKYGIVPVSAPDAIERVCFAFGAYAAIADSYR